MSRTRTPVTLRRGLALPVTVLAIVASGAVALSTGAIFTDTQTMDGNAFTSGTVRLDAGSTATPMSATNMVPGSQVFQEVPVKNTGSLGVVYRMDSVKTDPDADPANDGAAADLRLDVYAGVGSCTADNPVWDTSPASLYTGDISLDTVGQPHPVLAPRPLGATETEVLCLVATLRPDVSNDAQGKTWNVDFVFTAEQQ